MNSERAENRAAIYIDVSTIGSSMGVYGDAQPPLAARATTLLVDMIEAVHAHIFEPIPTVTNFVDRLQEIGLKLDALTAAATQVEVAGEVEMLTWGWRVLARDRGLLTAVNAMSAGQLSVGVVRRRQISSRSCAISLIRPAESSANGVTHSTVTPTSWKAATRSLTKSAGPMRLMSRTRSSGTTLAASSSLAGR